MKLIQSRDNPFFKHLKRLATSGRERSKTGQTLLDGQHLIEAYEQAFGPVETLVMTAAAMDRAPREWLSSRDVVQLEEVLMRDLGLVDTPTGWLAVVRPVTPQMTPNFTVDREKEIILLDGVQDPGNLGTLLRTAAAAGIGAAYLSPACASIWSPKVLRAGQGAHFAFKVYEDVDLQALLDVFPGTSLVTCLEEAGDLYATEWTTPVAWIFGAEGQGVSPALIARADQRIRIPMPGAVESLNVSAAAAVCLFESLRRRQHQITAAMALAT